MGRLQAGRGPLYRLVEAEFSVHMIRAEEKIRAVAAAADTITADRGVIDQDGAGVRVGIATAGSAVPSGAAGRSVGEVPEAAYTVPACRAGASAPGQVVRDHRSVDVQ